MLPKLDFIHVVRSAPLISIDLIFQNSADRYLLGLRNNSPAQGTWFVPGGRILKDESLDSAKRRLSKTEIGTEVAPERFSFIGVFEHFYSDNTFGIDGFGTHYVVLAFHCELESVHLDRSFEQHSKFKWFSKKEILRSNQIHAYTKAYFDPLS